MNKIIVPPYSQNIPSNQSLGSKSNVTVSSNAPDQKGSNLPPNAKVVGNYLMGKNIGQGTFGKVYLAMHMPTSEKVAVKLIDKKSMRIKDIGRVKNQIEILKTIRHRNIMHLYQIIETQKSLLLITEYLERGELFRVIIKQKKLSEEQACTYFQQIISGVQYLHNNKIAHRDLKPENILIDYDGQLKIIDFGLSKHFGKSKQLKSFCGSPCYAAPEIIVGKGGYNPIHTDIWSCGVILFVMLCGNLPFCDTDTHNLYKKIISCTFKIPNHISAAARNLIENLLTKNPNQRFSLSDIRNHEWFNLVNHKKAYGIRQGEKLKPNYDLITRLMEINVQTQKLVDNLFNGDMNKETASYFILMKKKVKKGELVSTYIGDDNFDPLQIDGIEVKDESQTVEVGDAPFMLDESQEPVSGSVPSIWFENLPLEEEKQMSQEQLRPLLQGIFSLVIKEVSNEQMKKIADLFDYTRKQTYKVKKFSMKKKQKQFYGNNPINQKAVNNMQQHNKVLLQTVEVTMTLSGNQKIRYNNRQIRHTTNSTKQKQVRIRTKTLGKPSTQENPKRTFDVTPRIIVPNKQKRIFKDIEKLIQSSDQKHVQKMLPYLTFIRDSKLKDMVSMIKQKRSKYGLSNKSTK